MKSPCAEQAAARAAHAWLGSKFAGHPDLECYCCAAACREEPSPAAPDGRCNCLRWRTEPPGSKEAGYDWQWTREVETFSAFVHNKTHVRMMFHPQFYLPIERVFPLRSARLGADLTLPVAKDYMWFFSNKVTWAAPQYKPAYGVGCRGVAYPPFLSSTTFGIGSEVMSEWDSYADVRLFEKGLFQCARWLHQHGFASFYGCFDADVGFGEPEDTADAQREDWHKIVGESHPLWQLGDERRKRSAALWRRFGFAGVALVMVAGSWAHVSRSRAL